MGDGEPGQLEVEREVEAKADSDVDAFAIELSTFPPPPPTQNSILPGSSVCCRLPRLVVAPMRIQGIDQLPYTNPRAQPPCTEVFG